MLAAPPVGRRGWRIWLFRGRRNTPYLLPINHGRGGRSRSGPDRGPLTWTSIRRLVGFQPAPQTFHRLEPLPDLVPIETGWGCQYPSSGVVRGRTANSKADVWPRIPLDGLLPILAEGALLLPPVPQFSG